MFTLLFLFISLLLMRKLTLKQETFAKAYTTIGTKTFGNGRQSALLAYNAKNPETAGAIATETLSKPYVRSYIGQLLDEMDLGVEVRSRVVREVILGTQTPTITETTHPDGSITTTKVTRPVSATARLKAVDLLNRMDGTYSRAGVEGEVARQEYAELRSRVIRQIRPDKKTGR